MELQELNHWWIEKKVKESFTPTTRRELFYEVEKDLSRKYIQIIVGLRRTGKSTILYQIISKLIAEKINPLNILYCSFDEPEFQEKKIEEILRMYSDIVKIDYKKEKIYLIVDEIQKSKDWVDRIKLIYDNYRNIKILISGSASLHILSDSKKTLAGRTIYYELKPLSFKEFLSIKKINIEKNKENLYKEIINREFENFLLRPFPEIVNEKDHLFIRKYIRDAIIDPIILKDIPKEFKEVDILLLEKIVYILLSNPGQIMSIDEMSRELSRAKTTLYKALFYLEFSFITKKVLNFRPSIKSASRKLPKVYPYHPALSLPFNIPKEKFIENLVSFEIDAKYYWRDREKEIDFIKDLIPIEVKYKEKIKKKDTDWIVYFMRKFKDKLKIKKAYIITKNLEGKIKEIQLIPIWKLCFKGYKDSLNINR